MLGERSFGHGQRIENDIVLDVLSRIFALLATGQYAVAAEVPFAAGRAVFLLVKGNEAYGFVELIEMLLGDGQIVYRARTSGFLRKLEGNYGIGVEARQTETLSVILVPLAVLAILWLVHYTPHDDQGFLILGGIDQTLHFLQGCRLRRGKTERSDDDWENMF